VICNNFSVLFYILPNNRGLLWPWAYETLGIIFRGLVTSGLDRMWSAGCQLGHFECNITSMFKKVNSPRLAHIASASCYRQITPSVIPLWFRSVYECFVIVNWAILLLV
jgi:hypothetical protein